MAVSLPLTCHKHNNMKSGKNGVKTHHVSSQYDFKNNSKL